MLDKRLGRGLKNLISGNSEPEAAGALEVSIDSILPNRLQPRRNFDPQQISELASSIRVHGIIQPVLARQISEGRYELISGERRLRASREAGLQKIPVILKDSISDREVLELAIIENLQRVDLDPIEKAKGFRQLSTEFGLTQEQVAERVGQDRSSVANLIRILELPGEIQDAVSRGTISFGHARALLGLSSKQLQQKVFAQVADKGMSVRETESLVRDSENMLVTDEPKKRRKNPLKPAWLGELETLFERRLGSKVRIRHGKTGRGKVQIEYSSDDELNQIAKKIGALDQSGLPQ